MGEIVVFGEMLPRPINILVARKQIGPCILLRFGGIVELMPETASRFASDSRKPKMTTLIPNSLSVCIVGGASRAGVASWAGRPRRGTARRQRSIASQSRTKYEERLESRVGKEHPSVLGRQSDDPPQVSAARVLAAHRRQSRSMTDEGPLNRGRCRLRAGLGACSAPPAPRGRPTLGRWWLSKPAPERRLHGDDGKLEADP
jgi:hypothetical protein